MLHFSRRRWVTHAAHSCCKEGKNNLRWFTALWTVHGGAVRVSVSKIYENARDVAMGRNLFASNWVRFYSNIKLRGHFYACTELWHEIYWVCTENQPLGQICSCQTSDFFWSGWVSSLPVLTRQWRALVKVSGMKCIIFFLSTLPILRQIFDLKRRHLITLFTQK